MCYCPRTPLPLTFYAGRGPLVKARTFTAGAFGNAHVGTDLRLGRKSLSDALRISEQRGRAKVWALRYLRTGEFRPAHIVGRFSIAAVPGDLSRPSSCPDA